ncbi:hypothetical protein AVDCRST_MAG92-4447, partial [uncultured Coleofasciculus sp.]
EPGNFYPRNIVLYPNSCGLGRRLFIAQDSEQQRSRRTEDENPGGQRKGL